MSYIYIIEILIKDEDINKDIRIINSYEEYQRQKNFPENMELDMMNEEEIKKFEIKINDELIPFNYFHKFPNKGKYTINYSFKNNLFNVGFIFNG